MDECSAALFNVLERPYAQTPEGVGRADPIDRVESVYGSYMDPPLTDVPSPTGGPFVVVRDLDQPDAMGRNILQYALGTAPHGSVTRIRAGLWSWVSYTHYSLPEAESPRRSCWPLMRPR